MKFYILGGKDDHEAVESDRDSWAQWYGEALRNESWHVTRDYIGKFLVSTVFLGIDHNFGLSDDRQPLLFETVVFENGEGGDRWRCATWDEALAQHARAVEDCRVRV